MCSVNVARAHRPAGRVRVVLPTVRRVRPANTCSSSIALTAVQLACTLISREDLLRASRATSRANCATGLHGAIASPAVGPLRARRGRHHRLCHLQQRLVLPCPQPHLHRPHRASHRAHRHHQACSPTYMARVVWPHAPQASTPTKRSLAKGATPFVRNALDLLRPTAPPARRLHPSSSPIVRASRHAQAACLSRAFSATHVTRLASNVQDPRAAIAPAAILSAASRTWLMVCAPCAPASEWSTDHSSPSITVTRVRTHAMTQAHVSTSMVASHALARLGLVAMASRALT